MDPLKKSLPVALAALSLLAGPVFARDQRRARSPERDMEIPLRVLRGGRVPDGLLAEDVQLLVDGAPRAISSWRRIERRIGAPPGPEPRFFALLFHLNACPDGLGPAIGKLVRGLLRDNDRLLVVAGQATLFLDDLSGREECAAAVEAFVREHAGRFQRLVQQEREALAREIETITSDYSRVTANIHRHYYMKSFQLSLNEHLSRLRKYRQRYLLPAPSLLYGLCPQLSGNAGEKWIVAFWQTPEIPRIPRKSRDLIAGLAADFQASAMLDENDYGLRFKRWLGEAETVFTGRSDFPGPDLYNLLAGSEATFHAFYLPPGDPALERDAEYQRAAGQAQGILAGLAENSGGLFRAFAEPEGDMAALGEKTDSYFILGFPPGAGYKNVNIRPVDSAASAWLAPRVDGGPEAGCRGERALAQAATIGLRDVTLQKRRLAFRIVRFLQGGEAGTGGGKVLVRVILKDGAGRRAFDQSQAIVPLGDEITVNLDLPETLAGKHTVIIEVGDAATGSSHARLLNARLE